MTQNNSLQEYNWDSQECEITETLRPHQDEVISVYEVYVKEEENPGSSEHNNDSDGSGSAACTSTTNSSSTTSNHQMRAIVKGLDVDVADSTEIMNEESDINDEVTSVMKLLGKESLKYKVVEQSVIDGSDNDAVFCDQTVSEQMKASSYVGPRLIDKDDPRSRLHFVKYLKRDGKTLKIWECGICTKEFRHQYTLMRHLPTHTDERNFKCDACGKAFRQLSTLSQHKAIHSDARPYVCEYCKKTFNRVSTLISHRKTHSELKPHKCHVCGKGFHQKGNLRNHVFTHTNERPYKCELCGKGFNQMSNLVCHKIKAHAHSEKMQYSCGICGKEFPRRFALRSHEEYKHGIKYRNPSGIPRERKLPVIQKPTSTSTCLTASPTKPKPNVTSSTTSISSGASVMQNKSVRIVELPSHERTEKCQVAESSQMEYTDSLVVNKIETRDLQNAIVEGQTPFALLKPVTGIPVLVKVSPAGPHKHLLTPATADDLQMLGKVSLSPTLTVDPGLKAMHVKVPVVATITQNFDENGKQSFSIEAPGVDQSQESVIAPLDSQFPFQNTESSLRLHSATASSLCSHAINDIVVEANSAMPMSTTTTAQPESQSDDCNELLELAAQGGIQFVRATEDGRYEVMTNNEARELMAQNSHDVTILDGEDADALNIVDTRGGGDISAGCCIQEDFMIDHPDNQIMVLDSMTNTQKSIDLEAIDIFEDKDIRILDPKNFDDRMIDGMTFLSQMKMDDLILLPSKSSDNISGCAISISSPSDNDFSGIAAFLNPNRNTINNNQPMNMSSLLPKGSSNLSLISDTMNYLRHCPSRSLSDELNILSSDKESIGGNLIGDSRQSQQQQQQFQHQEHYNGKIKFSDYEPRDLSNSLSIGYKRDEQSYQSGTDFYRENEAKISWDSKRAVPSFGEVKTLATKIDNIPNQDSLEASSSQFQDIRILGSYEQYVKSSGFGKKQDFFHANNHGTEDDVLSARKEIKILGKKLECGFLENNENGKLIKLEDDETSRRIPNDFWEGWIETNRCSGDNIRYDQDENDKENDLSYANIIDPETL
ncbi:uncharacterized protein [Venturia canescens]|uniref:uncharacterized protein n=1 Tax=Venturia canescens TaxID=32260 RepID=UPI001C9D14E0|nr:uncharacterized protein LOC122413111 [Venturia canescens]